MAKKVVQNYEIHMKELLGEGGFGAVYKCTDKITGQTQAIKMINKRMLTNDQYKLKALKSEISILHKIQSDHIVGFKDVLQTQRNYYIVMQLCNGDLRTLLKKLNTFPEKETISIMTQVLKGFYNLIVLGYVHRDLKPENILLKDNLVKVGDFGLSKRYNNQKLLDTAVGTMSYQAPQILTNDRYTHKCDIWAFGLIFYEVLYGKLPYKSSSFDNLLKELNPNFEVKFPEEPKVSEGVKEIIKKCLIVEEEGRADWDFLFEHPVFKDEVPSISNLKKRLKYILGRIRREIRQSNIDLNTFFNMIKNENQKKQIEQNQFAKMLTTIAPQLEGEQIKYIFAQFDENSDGRISLQEFEHCLKDNEIDFSAVKREDIQKEIIKCEDEEEMDPLEEDYMNRMEEVYQKLITYAFKQKLQNLHELYLSKESDEDGMNQDQFFKLLKELCPELNKQQCILVFQKFDENKDERISYGQFYKYLCKVIGKPFGKSFIK